GGGGWPPHGPQRAGDPLPLRSHMRRFELQLAFRDGQHVGGNPSVKLGGALESVDGVLLEKPAYRVEQLRNRRPVLHERRGTPRTGASQSRFGVRELAPLWGGRAA